MHDDVKRHAVRFIETTGRWADVDSFSEDDAWMFMQELLDEYARPFKPMSDGQLIVLRNLGAALGIRPGSPLRGYGPALKRALGQGSMSDDEIRELTRYIYGQINGGSDFEPKKRPTLSLKPLEVGERWVEHKPVELNPRPPGPPPPKPPTKR